MSPLTVFVHVYKLGKPPTVNKLTSYGLGLKYAVILSHDSNFIRAATKIPFVSKIDP